MRCIQYPVINHNGKEYKKEMCVCVLLSHFAVQQSWHGIVNKLYLKKNCLKKEKQAKIRVCINILAFTPKALGSH